MAGDYLFLTPSDLAEACRLLKDRAGHTLPIAGGTRLVTEWRLGGTPPSFVLDLADAGDLRYRYRGSKRFHLGPLIELSDLAGWPELASDARALSQAAASVAPLAVRNRATLGGNVLQRPPVGDTGVVLLALDARIRVKSTKSERDLSLDRLWDDAGRSAITPDEIAVDVAFNPADKKTDSGFVKIGSRTAVRPAPVLLAARLTLSPSGQISQDLRLSRQIDGGWPRRGLRAEKIAAGKRIRPDVVDEVAEAFASESCPERTPAFVHRERVVTETRALLEDLISRIRVRIGA